MDLGGRHRRRARFVVVKNVVVKKPSLASFAL